VRNWLAEENKAAPAAGITVEAEGPEFWMWCSWIYLYIYIIQHRSLSATHHPKHRSVLPSLNPVLDSISREGVRDIHGICGEGSGYESYPEGASIRETFLYGEEYFLGTSRASFYSSSSA
jgi:hypothetical protein